MELVKSIVVISGALLALCNAPVMAQQKAMQVSYKYIPGNFPIVKQGLAAPIVIDAKDAEVVKVVAVAWSNDIRQISGTRPQIKNDIRNSDMPVIAGTLGKSSLIDQLAAGKLIPVEKVRGKWETFCLAVVNRPFKNVKQALVIFGSDPRGTAYGIFELSKMAGVSPLVWWADVNPATHKEISITPGKTIIGPPSVKYRGLFINDEDWGLQPWAAKNMDTDIKDIGPKTYAHVFELLLRLKANYIWPAMHPCTKAFWYYPGNPEMARKYDIVLGASHCEPLLRNNVFEWAENFKNEYGTEPGQWRYDVNKAQIDRYWEDRANASKNNDAVYTVGMRGVHDGSMPGPPAKEDKKKLLEEVIQNQRNILSKGLGKPASTIDQIFCPYKEVLDLYRLHMNLPDDITLAWADDNYGYMRQLSNPDEQKRSGGSGVYYHFSYWGAPEDYLWLSTNSPMLTSYELSKAYELNDRKLWVFNVGDIKPAEMELQFAMDLAWNISAWTPEKAHRYPQYWAAQTFGNEFGERIGNIKSAYYRLAAAGKPEHLSTLPFTGNEIRQRLNDYQTLVNETEALAKEIPPRLKDAFFELIEYPVLGACSINEKVLLAKLSLKHAAEGNTIALEEADRAKAAFENIQKLTERYNQATAGGKWNGIMSWHPRDLKYFNMPEVATPDKMAPTPQKPAESLSGTVIAAADFSGKSDGQSRIKLINGLGISKKAVTVWPMIVKSFSNQDITGAPYVEYQVNMQAGDNTVNVKCLPDFPLYPGMELRYAIAINGEKPQFVNIATKAETKPWAANVLRGYTSGETTYHSQSADKATIRIYLPDPGVVLNTITVKAK